MSVFSPNAGKYGLEKLRIPTLFMQCLSPRRKTITMKTKVAKLLTKVTKSYFAILPRNPYNPMNIFNVWKALILENN